MHSRWTSTDVYAGVGDDARYCRLLHVVQRCAIEAAVDHETVSLKTCLMAPKRLMSASCLRVFDKVSATR